jgi:hypothetical protein
VIHFIGNGPEATYQLALLRREFEIARLKAPQAARAKAKAERTDDAVRLIIEEITATRLEAGQPPLEDAALTNEIAARLHAVEKKSSLGERAAQLESVRKRVLRSLKRQGLR